MSAHKSRPGGGSGAASSVVATQVQDTETPRIPHLSAAEIDASRPTYALLVKSPSGRISRRLYLSLHSAVKATERAQMRGHAVTLELCRLVPYTTGSELHAGVESDA